ncbi:hypothetical protein Q1695_010657 [Nippostrongylus brasiliensis]|nr:hypothetical protein Q1695_010657 [Nippostrongylus brasiliensis]
MFYLASKTERYSTDENGFCRPGSSTDVSNAGNIPRSVTFTACNEYFEDRQSTRRIGFKQRASQIILQVPAEQIRRIKETEGIGSISRESQHFSQTTTMHGPKRIYQGKRFSTHFWILMVLTSGILLIYQVATLLSMYFSNPTVSQVSFLISENGLDFPMVTLCNFNPIKKSYIRTLNETGDFSDQLLDYLIQSLMDTQALYGNADRAELHIGDRALQIYRESHPNFTIDGFFYAAGFNCSETMKLCSFGGRQFDCCKFMEPRLTNLGKCHTLDMRAAREWMQKQTVAGVNAGLQIILDAHMEEQLDGTGDDADPIFSNAFENGFRYYVHAPDTVPYLVSEGISVSPGTRVYSAISTNTYVLLSSENWGNCTEQWPSGYATQLPYSAVNCDSLCKAYYFNDRCGCSPFTYNIDISMPMCTPYQTFQCIDQHIRTQINGTDYFHMPQCQECKIECNSLIYHAYNSYGQGFSHGALKWLNRKNPEWSKAHMRANFLTVNVFFRDMAHTEYKQVQATSLTEILSDIGGNMGMFLGMSLITVTEISLFMSKIGWIAFSKRRRDYLFNKKKRELEREKQLEETVSTFSMFRSRKVGSIRDSFRATQSRLRSLSKHLPGSFRESKPSETKPPPLENLETGRCTAVVESVRDVLADHLKRNLQNGTVFNGSKRDSRVSMIELQIDLRDIKRKLTTSENRRRKRASTAPPTSHRAQGDVASKTSRCSGSCDSLSITQRAM